MLAFNCITVLTTLDPPLPIVTDNPNEWHWIIDNKRTQAKQSTRLLVVNVLALIAVWTAALAEERVASLVLIAEVVALAGFGAGLLLGRIRPGGKRSSSA